MSKRKIFFILIFNIFLLYFIVSFLNNYIEDTFNPDTSAYSSVLEKIQIAINERKNKKNNIEKPYDFNEYTELYNVKQLPLSQKTFEKFCGEKRISYGEQYKKNPIVILGCSYTYGHGLKKEESFPYYLSEITERPVLNFSVCGSEIISSYQNFYKYLDDNLHKNLVKNTDYIVYVYMFDHINRYMQIRVFYNNYNDIFEPKGLEKTLIKIPVFKYVFASYRLQKVFDKYPKNEEAARIMKKIIILYFKKIEKYAPNSKKIIIIYDEKIADKNSVEDIIYKHELMTSSIWKEIAKETDIKVLHTKEITGILFDKNYKLKEDIADWHPNAKAWQVFTPKFAEEYIK